MGASRTDPGTVRLTDVRVVRRGRTVLDAVDAVFGTGIAVVVGANGAGKSSLLSAIATLLPVEQGSVEVGGFDLADRRGRRRARALIGYLAQAGSFPGSCTVEESVAYAAWLQRVDGDREAAIDRALAVVDLQRHRADPLGRLSGGLVQRARLAQAIVHEPPVLLLDEPTVALDLVHAQELRHQIARIGSDRCVVMASHLVEDVERFGDRVLVVRDGGVAFDGSAAEVQVRAEGPASLGEALAAVMGGGARCS
jgi:ABC-2 type transport system ATP-binding protein